MEWSGSGRILRVRPHGETSAIVDILTREHGRHAAESVANMPRKAHHKCIWCYGIIFFDPQSRGHRQYNGEAKAVENRGKPSSLAIGIPQLD